MNGTTTTIDDVQSVPVSDDEHHQGKYSPLSLQKALEALHKDGLVLLKGVIDVKHIQALNDKMCADAELRRTDPNQVYNHGVKYASYLFEDVYFNPFLLQVANAYLGHRPIWNWLTSNTALSHTSGLRQPPHKDCAFAHPQYPYYFIANIPLCEFSIDNGTTEFWLGSHAHASWREQVIATDPEQVVEYGRLGEPLPRINEEAKEARRRVRPPVQPACCPGDIMIRDLRLWHAGMPNGTDTHRIMIGLGYQSPVYPNHSMRCHLPASQKRFFSGSTSDMVEVRASFYDDEEFQKLTKDAIFELRPDYLE
ncbi:phytanoyl-dioxygenase family protein [Exophiala viscosa]|uniref:Phytanoyl-dioxygenase family protein n=1 Tax=Exophiala viscosa TaxID=2486360 RepID=A0AAN6IBU9_9EURO|nr:phytanoyl-dioxygenase family protein [Exophiala viscosa]